LKGNPLSKTKQMSVWFTPLSFSIENGVLHSGRMDALIANSVHLCTWGSIDLQTQKLHMYLGIPADTLKSAFGLKNLSANYVLKIPIRGSVKDPDLKTNSATAKIAAMVAAQQIPKKGAVLGGLVNAFAQSKEEKDIPPAKHPFPWEH
jgi:hypothetical protein